MACFNGVLKSEAIGGETGVSVIIPHDRATKKLDKYCKVLYLLHGLGQSATSWIRGSGIERYAAEAGLVVVMPEVERSFYSDMAMGSKYFTYITKELTLFCEKSFGISSRRQDTFIAGLSMGGYGAVKCAMTYPEKYAACASFSGVLDINYVFTHETAIQDPGPLQAVFGLDLKPSAATDCFLLAEKTAKTPALMPRVYIACGTEDYLLPLNRSYKNHLQKLGFNLKYEEWAGSHDWSFWDVALQKSIDYFVEDKQNTLK